jgi:formylglycine-generating enzyme required for sulfatase activity/serine/threonine protein kinase
MSELFADRYDIQHELGRGAFGVVYLAHDVRLRDRPVALKVLHPALSTDPQVVRLFENEAGILAALRHDHIITVYDVGVWELRRFIVMDYVAGPSLAQVVKEQGAQPPERVQDWLRQAAEALAYAHGQGVLHRDVKSANLLLETARDRLFVSDFGLARAAEASGGSSVQSDAHLLTGTAAYRAPEAHRTGHSVASDLYSLGVVGYELLAGQRPFESDDPLSLMLLHATEPVPPLPAGTPATLAGLVMALLAKDPAQRPASAEAVVKLLADSNVAPAPPPQEATPPAADLPPVKPPPSPPPPVSSTDRPSERPPRRWLGWLAGTTALTAVVVMTFWVLTGGGQGRNVTLTATGLTPGLAVLPRTASPLAPTDTQVPSFSTALPSTDTPAPPTDTSAPLINTPAPPTDTPVPPTSTPAYVVYVVRAGDNLASIASQHNVSWQDITAANNITAPYTIFRAQVLVIPGVTATPTPVLGIGSTMISEIDGTVMVYVSAGEFLMGTRDDQVGEDDERPQHTVHLDSYWIDKTEVTSAQYRRCVEAGECSAPDTGDNCTYSTDGRSDHPINCVDWDQAATYCTWVGRRLPTEAEWEKAARGVDGRIYPWGDAWDVQMTPRLNSSDKDHPGTPSFDAVDDGFATTAPVGSFPAGASPYGALDMAGNVWEWAADWYDKTTNTTAPRETPTGPGTGSLRVLRGGSWFDSAINVRAARSNGRTPGSRDDRVGFRCARSP